MSTDMGVFRTFFEMEGVEVTVNNRKTPKKERMTRFVATKDTCGERAKAAYKNSNSKLLARMYYGDEDEELHCLITGEPGWKVWPCIVEGEDKLRFQIEFDHIRQRKNLEKTAVGISVDKIGGKKSPSAMFRQPLSIIDLIEFACMIPIDASYHKHITQTSYNYDILLHHYSVWPWHLRSEEDFKAMWDQYNIKNFTHAALVEHLNDIDAKPIRERIIETKTGFAFK